MATVSNERRKEVGSFMLVGLVATIVDYALLNTFVGLLKLPLLLANSLSAPLSSFISYKLNKNVVFEDRMHGRRKTLFLYVGILAFGILIIQNVVLHFANGMFTDSVAHTVKPFFDFIGLDALSFKTLSINIAKVCASFFSALWNYYMLRQFVFVTQDE